MVRRLRLRADRTRWHRRPAAGPTPSPRPAPARVAEADDDAGLQAHCERLAPQQPQEQSPRHDTEEPLLAQRRVLIDPQRHRDPREDDRRRPP